MPPARAPVAQREVQQAHVAVAEPLEDAVETRMDGVQQSPRPEPWCSSVYRWSSLPSR